MMAATAAALAMREMDMHHIPVVGLAKRFEEIFVPDEDEPIVLPRGSEALYLVQRVRDEAHRFAITFHRKLRAKRTLKSALDGIEGIGPSKRKALLTHFGSVERIRQANPESLTEVPGISKLLAERILAALGV